MIDRCVVEGRIEVPPDLKGTRYVAAVDAAYKGDRFTMCVAHHDNGRQQVVVDLLTGWQGSKESPLKLGKVLPQIKAIAKRYGVVEVFGDQFGAEPLKEAFGREYLTYEERTFTNQSKADIYATLRSRIMDGAIELLDHQESLKELRGLELENLPGGSIRIGHAKHGRAHDDYADSMALAVSEALHHRYSDNMAYAVGHRECHNLFQ